MPDPSEETTQDLFHLSMLAAAVVMLMLLAAMGFAP